MTYHAYTTLNEIRKHNPCKGGWNKLLTHLGKTKADDEPLHLLTILDSNGLDDALWCLQAKSLDRLSRHFQAWCAEQVLHIFESERPDDMRVREQIAMLRNDDATQDEREAARVAAREAESVVHGVLPAAGAVARAAVRAAAWVAAWDAARKAARVAARKAARKAAGGVEWEAAWDAARKAAHAAACAAQEAQLRAMIGTPQEQRPTPPSQNEANNATI